MGVSRSMRAAIVHRAGRRCEYYHLPMDLMPDPYHIDHITARQHGGETALHNLALSCTHCNAHKGPNLAGIDPDSKGQTNLFHPRNDSWAAHFERQGAVIRGLTSVGRATIAALAMNDPDRMELRMVLIAEGRLSQNESS